MTFEVGKTYPDVMGRRWEVVRKHRFNIEENLQVVLLVRRKTDDGYEYCVADADEDNGETASVLFDDEEFTTIYSGMSRFVLTGEM